MPRFEVHMIRAVHAAGVPVPEVFGEVPPGTGASASC